MATLLQTDQEKYAFLVKNVQRDLARALADNVIDDERLLAFLYLFRQAQEYWELRLFLAVFEQQFTFLNDVKTAIREIRKGDIEKCLKNKLPGLMKDDPDKVVEITKYAARADTDLARLLEKYPELKSHD